MGFFDMQRANKSEQDVVLTSCPDPFSVRRINETVPVGWTIGHMVLHSVPRSSVSLAHVYVNGVYVPREMWLSVRPKSGVIVTIRTVPGKGGGKSPLATVLSIALLVAAPMVGAALGSAMGASMGFMQAGILWNPIGSLTWTAIGTGVVNIAGKLAINAIAPPSRPRTAGSGIASATAAERPTLFVTGGRNQVLPLGRIPRVLGRHRMMPPMGAFPYTETVGSDQYLRMLFVWGYGPLSITDIRIGDTSISEFNDVEIETRQGFPGDAPLALYTNVVIQTDLQVSLMQEASWQVRTTEAGCTRLSIDITFPSGLFQLNAQGAKLSRTVEVAVEYAPTGTTAWIAAPVFSVTAQQNAALRINKSFDVPAGRYDVRLRRTTADSASDQIFDGVMWTALRSIKPAYPISMPGLAVTALRIKATDQINGVVDQLNGVVQSILPDWDAAAGAWVERATANPASLFRRVLQGPENARPLADNRIDVGALQDWHADCSAAGREFNYVVDSDRGLREVLADIAAAGRATPGLVDGKWAVVRDRPQTVPIQHFTTRNTFGFKGEKAFDDLPHALKVRFVNRDKDWQPDERVVYDDGYDENTATKFEGLEFTGITDPTHVWKDGRYHIATARLRPEKFTFGADVEHIVCTRGDLIRFSHDVPLFGLARGRIKSLSHDFLRDAEGNAIEDGEGNHIINPDSVLSIVLDETVFIEEGKTYNIRARLKTGASVVCAVNTVPGHTSTLHLSTPFLGPVVPGVGDLVMFGETGEESVELIVKSIEPNGDLTATITCVPAAPAVHSADQGAIPAYDSQVTVPPDMRRPPAPVVSRVQSGNDALVISTGGNYSPSIILTLDTPSYPFQLSPVVFVRAQEETVARSASISSFENKVTVIDVDAGKEYDLSVYYRSASGMHSATTLVPNISVTGGQGHPPPVSIFTAQQNGGTIVFKWSEVVWYALKGYDILYVPQGGSVDGAVFLTQAARGTEMTNASVPPGAWTFYIRARDFAGQVSQFATTVNLNVVNENTEIFSRSYAPDWQGNEAYSSGFYKHWTGRLVPIDQNAASDYGWEVFDQFVPMPVSECIFSGIEIDSVISAPVRVWNNITAINGPGQAGNPDVQFRLASSEIPFSDPMSFEEFSLGFVSGRYFAGQIVYRPEAGSVSFVDLFRIVGDAQVVTKAINGFPVSAGGSSLVFADYGLQFHDEPNVQVTVSSGTGTSATAIDCTILGAEIRIYNGVTSVSGNVNITITGV